MTPPKSLQRCKRGSGIVAGMVRGRGAPQTCRGSRAAAPLMYRGSKAAAHRT